MQRSFQESMRFPMPAKPVLVKVYGRDANNGFAPLWSVRVDPQALDVERVARPAPAKPIAIRRSGDPSDKVDLLLLGDGYTADEMDKFEARARELADRLFSVSPFKERAADFNVWALAVPVPESGVSRPSTGVHRAVGDRRALRHLRQRALRADARQPRLPRGWPSTRPTTRSRSWSTARPTAAVASSASSARWRPTTTGATTCSCTSSATTSPAWPTSTTPRRSPMPRPTRRVSEPWEPNVTALLDPRHLKWQDRMTAATPVPTPWPKAEFEAHERDIQARRKQLREQRRPEAEMSALFREEQAYTDKLFADVPASRCGRRVSGRQLFGDRLLPPAAAMHDVHPRRRLLRRVRPRDRPDHRSVQHGTMTGTMARIARPESILRRPHCCIA